MQKFIHNAKVIEINNVTQTILWRVFSKCMYIYYVGIEIFFPIVIAL